MTATVSSSRRARSVWNIVRAILIVITIAVFLFPLAWMVIASLRSNRDIIDPSSMFTAPFTLANYLNAFGRENMLPFIANSAFVGGVSTLLGLLIGAPGAYVISRHSMHRVGMIVLAARIIPGISLLVPWYFMFAKLGLVGSIWALVITHLFVTLPLVVWILTSFFDTVPVELEEQAKVDGLSSMGAFVRIVIPLARAGIATAASLSFIFSWNNFIFALVFSGRDTRTLPIAIYNFIGYAAIDWGGLMAATVIITAPIMLLTLAAQKFIIAGVTAGAMKG